MKIKSYLVAALSVFAVILTLGLVLITDKSSQASVEIGETAPDFTGTTSNGETISLADLKGQVVVLEWTNHECPFVVKHYGSGNMQALQEKYKDDVVWLSVISSAPGKQGHVSGEKANELTISRSAHPAHVILDETGEIGKLYGAATTPHMFVIDENMNVVYEGAIDSDNSANPASIEGATNYVDAALTALLNGTDIETPKTRPYGCSVKY